MVYLVEKKPIMAPRFWIAGITGMVIPPGVPPKDVLDLIVIWVTAHLWRCGLGKPPVYLSCGDKEALRLKRIIDLIKNAGTVS